MQSYFDRLNSDVLISIFMELTSTDMNKLYHSHLINFDDINFKELYQRFNDPIIRKILIRDKITDEYDTSRPIMMTYHRCDKVLESQPIFKSKFVYEILSCLLLDLKNGPLRSKHQDEYEDFIIFVRSLDNMYLLYTQHRELYDIIANYKHRELYDIIAIHKHNPSDYWKLNHLYDKLEMVGLFPHNPDKDILLNRFSGQAEKVCLFPIDTLLRNSSPMSNIFDINDLLNFINLDIIKATDYFFRENHTIISQSIFMSKINKNILINKENTLKFIDHIMTNYSDRVDIFKFVNICYLFRKCKPKILKLLLSYNIDKYLAVNDGIDELIKLKKSVLDRDKHFFSVYHINLEKCGSAKSRNQIYAESNYDYIKMLRILKKYFGRSKRLFDCFNIIDSICEIIGGDMSF